jgi:hypothetical protein
MQSHESDLMIGADDSVANHFRLSHDQDFLGTVHDSVLLDASLVPETESLIKAKFADQGLGITTKNKPMAKASEEPNQIPTTKPTTPRQPVSQEPSLGPPEGIYPPCTI